MQSAQIVFALVLVVAVIAIWFILRKPASKVDTYPETGDLQADADLRMAYGEYKFAKAIVERGLDRERNRTDLQMKLLEVCFVWGNEAEFVAAAQKYQSDLRDAGEWDKVEIMGKQVAPNDFS